MSLKKKGVIVISILAILFICSSVSGNALIKVEDMVFCKGIHHRQPVHPAIHFSNSVGRVFCYTSLSSVDKRTAVSHVWYYGDVKMAIVDLPVNATSWRTWSSKRIVKAWTGAWRVDVISSTGNIICSEKFFITAGSE